MRAFLLLCANDFEGDDDGRPFMAGKPTSAERREYLGLASVSSHWRQTLTGLMSRWLRRRSKSKIESECHLMFLYSLFVI